MCGISGILGGDDRARSRLIDEQLRLLHHRGPDARGAYAKGEASIAQNRLAIIDLVTGDPPVTNEDGSIGAVLNGEIYNFTALRQELEASGHRMSTKGDTEVLAHLAEQGASAVEIARRLDGMFAFAIWDSVRERLLLGRDRPGKKPLFYSPLAGGLVFASEIKGVLAHPDVSRDLWDGAIPEYLALGYVSDPRTFYRDVWSLPPGHVMTVLPGEEPVVESYWDLPLPRPGRRLITAKDAATQLRAHLSEAVRKRLAADVPVGAFLSGGIDSSAVVALAAQHSNRPVTTFTIGFEDRQGFDERPYARRVAQFLGTDHHEHVVKPDAISLLERLVWHYDEPFGDSSAIPMFYLSEVCRRDVTVALSGDGGDELFAGYQRFVAGQLVGALGLLPRRPLGVLSNMVGDREGMGPQSRAARARRFLATVDLGLPGGFVRLVSFFSEPDRARLLGQGRAPATPEPILSAWDRSTGSTLNRLLALNYRTYLLDDLLVKVDRNSMAHGLEVRSPLLDTALTEWAFRLPAHHKVRGLRLKHVLREACKDLVPLELLTPGKKGFGVPLDRWLREDLATYVDSTLGAPSARVREHVDGNALDACLKAHRTGKRNLGFPIWSMLTLETFLRARHP